MTIAPEPDPDVRQRATDGAAGAENDRQLPRRGELWLVSARRDDPHPTVAAAASLPAGGRFLRRCERPGKAAATGAAGAAQTRLGWRGPRAGGRWASPPQRSREMGLALLARLIDSGAVEEGGVDGRRGEDLKRASARIAFTYVRQSTPAQVRNNTESRELQYEPKERAVGLGWPAERVRVIDSDLGISADRTALADREGFRELAGRSRSVTSG